jgi:hypothetical protein
LLRYGFTHKFRIQLRPLDLENVDLNILVSQLLQLFLDLINFISTFTNYYAGTGCVNREGYPF